MANPITNHTQFYPGRGSMEMDERNIIFLKVQVQATRGSAYTRKQNDRDAYKNNRIVGRRSKSTDSMESVHLKF